MTMRTAVIGRAGSVLAGAVALALMPVGGQARANQVGGQGGAAGAAVAGPTPAAWGGGPTGAGGAVVAEETAASEVPPSEVPLGPGVVGIVGGPPGDALLANTAARIQMELGAAAIPSRFIDCANADARETEACGSILPAEDDGARPTRGEGGGAAALAGRDLRSDTTVISLSRRTRAVIMEVVANLANGTKVFRLVHVSIDKSGPDSTVLAIRAAELLRDVRLEVARARRTAREEQQGAPPAVPLAMGQAAPPSIPPAPRPPAAAAAPGAATLVAAGPASRPHSLRWSVSAAAALLVAESGFKSYAPALIIAVARGPHLSLAVTAAGPFSEKLQKMDASSADTRQEFATVGARWGWDAGWIRPSLGLGAGAYHLRVVWTPIEPPPGLTTVADSFWAPAFVPRAGLAFPIAKQLSVGVEYSLLFTAPSVELWGGSRLLGRVGGPSHLVAAGIVADLP